MYYMFLYILQHCSCDENCDAKVLIKINLIQKKVFCILQYIQIQSQIIPSLGGAKYAYYYIVPFSIVKCQVSVLTLILIILIK